MRVFALWALLAASEGLVQMIIVSKCCGEDHVLSGDGQACVEAGWPSNASLHRDEDEHVLPPLDEGWLGRWLAPGLPVSSILVIRLAPRSPSKYTNAVSVNASLLWNPKWRNDEEPPPSQIPFSMFDQIVRSEPEGGFRTTSTYCTDAAQPPLGPFALLFSSDCFRDECFRTCCGFANMLVADGHNWKCQPKSEELSWPSNPTFSKFIDLETSVEVEAQCPSSLRMVPPDELSAHVAHYGHHDFSFSSWELCFDYFRFSNGTVDETVFYCEHSRITRGLYRLLAPLCFVSAVLLLAALVSVASNSSMRIKAHGWCLGCHALCLFAFNLGQIAYYLTSDVLVNRYGLVRPHHVDACENFAFSMYFLLIAGWSWLTSICVNMALGFRKLQVARPGRGGGGGGDRRSFLFLSLFAWGLPAVLTSVAVSAFKKRYYILVITGVLPMTDTIYMPTLQETRVCFNEAAFHASYFRESIYKSGSGVYYYAPICSLVLINVLCLALTLGRVQFLRRGNSVLRRDEDRRPRGQQQAEEDVAARGDRQTRGAFAADAKTIRLYMKMLLMTGCVEFTAELIVWSGTDFHILFVEDTGLAYRAAGYVTDCFRAACVLWLAAPEGGYLGALRKRFVCDGKRGGRGRGKRDGGR